jgi:hypothetical protein
MLSAADVTKLETDLRDRLADWRGLLQRHPQEARHIVRTMLVGRLVFTPETIETGPRYRFSGQITLGRVLAGEILPRLPMKLETLSGADMVQPVDVQRIVDTTSRKQYRARPSAKA